MTTASDAPAPCGPALHLIRLVGFQDPVPASALSPGSASLGTSSTLLLLFLCLSLLDYELWGLGLFILPVYPAQYLGCVAHMVNECSWGWGGGLAPDGNTLSRGPEMSTVCLEVIKANIPGGVGHFF